MAIAESQKKPSHGEDQEFYLTTIWDEGKEEEAPEQPVQLDEFHGVVELKQAGSSVLVAHTIIPELIKELRDIHRRFKDS